MILVALLVFAVPMLAVAQESGWKVSREQARCLLDNANRYLEANNEPILIVIAACPIVDPTDALKQFEINSATPSIKVGEDTVMDSVIIYTREEFECLINSGFASEIEPVELPREPCHR